MDLAEVDGGDRGVGEVFEELVGEGRLWLCCIVHHAGIVAQQRGGTREELGSAETLRTERGDGGGILVGCGWGHKGGLGWGGRGFCARDNSKGHSFTGPPCQTPLLSFYSTAAHCPDAQSLYTGPSLPALPYVGLAVSENQRLTGELLIAQ